MSDLALLAVVLVVTAILAWWWRRQQGRVRVVDGGDIDVGALGVAPGATVLVEFTAPGCVPCSAAQSVLDEVAAVRPDVVVVTADVGDHLDLARRHSVLRAPTTLVVDRQGSVRYRLSGIPDQRRLGALLDDDVRQVRA